MQLLHGFWGSIRSASILPKNYLPRAVALPVSGAVQAGGVRKSRALLPLSIASLWSMETDF